ncbi:unnamed protein product [Fusarium venenatum]|uniref:Heterokaryon incompatibility domain-containing protein n=1 Tax=Fusarium venenatum TaxID=56646 RepID=A0A2L2T9Y2_9HYPO|nr:uncharacterized protein FVRRES_13719 [Fusarium venenatum]CEI41740.1 unnamed protein product [Fusarium venenatum]
MPPLNLMPHSCMYCRNIAIDTMWSYNRNTVYPLRNKLASLGFGDRLGPLHQGTYPFQFTFRQTRYAANYGCDFARRLLLGSNLSRYDPSLFGSSGFMQHPMDSWELVAILNAHRERFKTSSWFSSDNIARVVPDISSIEFAFASLKPSHSSDPGEQEVMYKHVGAEFDVFAYPGDPAAGHISARPIEAEPASGEALAKLGSWLRTCQIQHANCHRVRADGSKWTPTRLLDVWGDSDSRATGMARLVEPAITQRPGQLFPFAALSYTWGGDQPLRLEKKTELALKQGISLEDLPQTLRDAAFVCVRLGLRYLWIDALCINQDDDSDKAREISTMPKVYGHAVITISATRSPSAKHGFLGRRSLEQEAEGVGVMPLSLGGYPEVLQEAYQIPFLCANNNPLLARRVGSIILCAPDQELEPLLTRGWTFQEQLLATRTIEFGSLRTSWHCLESHGVGGFVDGWKDSSKDLDDASHWHDKYRKFWQIGPYSDPSIDTNETKVKALQIWKGMVETYSARNLTNTTDRILAISGIVDKLSPLLGTYRAGLWEPSLVAELLWMIDPVKDQDEMHRLLPRPCTYQGPSWSWVSVNSPITYMELSSTAEDDVTDDTTYFSFQEFNATPYSPPLLNRHNVLRRMTEITKCQTEPAYLDAPFGSIKEESALLQINCAMRNATMSCRKKPDQGDDLFSDAVLNQAFVQDREVMIFPDTLDDAISDHATAISVQLLEIAMS